MNSMEYEVDSMGGLMPQILALTAPPGTRDMNPQQQSYSASYSHLSSNGNGQVKPPEAGLAAHPYFRRPGRGHNHDCCDACSEGGDLICCDLCPASFHLTCHDPPLDEDEIPTGEWACHQCRMGGNEDDRNSCSSSKSTKGSKHVRKRDDVKQKEDNDKKVFAGGREFEISKTPLTTLIKAAAVINPTQFSLPYEMTLPVNFPGEPKETMIRKNGSRRGLPKKKPYELDNGIVPLPAKLCFQCNKSCRVGSLIPCDFCPLFYHLDCLDPPLTTPPMGLWMCPNHPEHHMDTTLLQSHSLTERVKLWDKFSVPVDQHSVKLKFFQRCHRAHPPFRFKVKKAMRSRLKVPDAIKAHYEDPPDLLPHLSPSHYLPFPPPHDPCASPTTATSKATLPTHPITQSHPITSTSTTAITTNATPVCSTQEVKELHLLPDSRKLSEAAPAEKFPDEDFGKQNVDDGAGVVESGGRVGVVERAFDVRPTQDEKDEWLASLLSLQSSIIRHMALPRKEPIKTEDLSPTSPPRPNFLNGDLTPHESRGHKICLDGMSNHIGDTSGFSRQQSALGFPLGKKSGHKAQKRSSSRSKRNTPHEILSETLTNLGESLRERIEEKHDLSLSSLDQSVVEVLAYERLKEILDPPKPALVRSMPALCTRALLCPLVPDVRLKDYAPKHRKYCSDPVPMVYRILNIGKGSNNHVDLEKYGHCNYISQNHACILFDETTGHYELLNYSEFDTKVDGVTYHCDYTDKTVSQGTSPPFLQHVKAIIASRRGDRTVMVTSPPPAMNSRPGEDIVRCECKRESEMFLSKPLRESGWEGTAVLHHGSYIRFGCIQFVFSVVEEASKGDWAKDTEITYEKFLKEANEERASDKEKTKEKEKQKEAEEKEMDTEPSEKEEKKDDTNISKDNITKSSTAS